MQDESGLYWTESKTLWQDTTCWINRGGGGRKRWGERKNRWREDEKWKLGYAVDEGRKTSQSPLFLMPVSFLLISKRRNWNSESCSSIKANEISFESQKKQGDSGALRWRGVVVMGFRPEWVRVDSQRESWWKVADPPLVRAICSNPSLCSLPFSPLCWFPLSIRSILFLWELIHQMQAEKHSH